MREHRWERATGQSHKTRKIWELEIANIVPRGSDFTKEYLTLWLELFKNLMSYHIKFSSDLVYSFIIENA